MAGNFKLFSAARVTPRPAGVLGGSHPSRDFRTLGLASFIAHLDVVIPPRALAFSHHGNNTAARRAELPVPPDIVARPKKPRSAPSRSRSQLPLIQAVSGSRCVFDLGRDGIVHGSLDARFSGVQQCRSTRRDPGTGAPSSRSRVFNSTVLDQQPPSAQPSTSRSLRRSHSRHFQRTFVSDSRPVARLIAGATYGSTSGPRSMLPSDGASTATWKRCKRRSPA